MGGADARNLISARNAPPHTKAPVLALSFLRWAGVPPATKELLELELELRDVRMSGFASRT